jgi:hypothetical protein
VQLGLSVALTLTVMRVNVMMTLLAAFVLAAGDLFGLFCVLLG